MDTSLYGLVTNVLLEDLSYDEDSRRLFASLICELAAAKYNTIEIEERRRNEALIAAAKNEGGNGMNLLMG